MYISYCVWLIIQVYWLNSHLIKPKAWIQLSLASFFYHLNNLLLSQTMYSSFAIQDTWFLKICFLISLCSGKQRKVNVNKYTFYSGSSLLHRFKSEWSLHYFSFGSKYKILAPCYWTNAITPDESLRMIL